MRPEGPPAISPSCRSYCGASQATAGVTLISTNSASKAPPCSPLPRAAYLVRTLSLGPSNSVCVSGSWPRRFILSPATGAARDGRRHGRFPPPWSVDELDAYFVVRDHDGQAAYGPAAFCWPRLRIVRNAFLTRQWPRTSPSPDTPVPWPHRLDSFR